MKRIAALFIALFIVNAGYSQVDEKRIKFSSGTLKLCTQANLKIKGYDGDEVIIKSLNDQTRFVYSLADVDGMAQEQREWFNSDSFEVSGIRYLTFSGEEKELEEGLEPLGEKSKSPADNLFLDITEKPGELIIKDYQSENGLEYLDFLAFNNEYEITIPNSVKLLWNTNDCSKKNSNTFFAITGSEPSEISNFKGEVEISLSYGSISLIDVSGSVIANTIGGNIQVEFKKTTPTKLYSLITENGYINIELPEQANLTIDATGKRILSNINFEVLNEEVTSFERQKKMRLKLNSGTVKMKLDAGSGSIYLRKN